VNFGHIVDLAFDTRVPHTVDTNIQMIMQAIQELFVELQLDKLGFIPDLELVLSDKQDNAFGYVVFRNQKDTTFNIYIPFIISNGVFDGFKFIVFNEQVSPFSLQKLQQIIMMILQYLKGGNK